MASIKSNYIYSVAYQILSIIVPIFTIPYVSRIFGAKGLGIYSYTASISQYFVLFAMLGLNNYGVRTIAMVRNDKKQLNRTFSEIWFMQLGTSIVVFLLYICFAFLCGGLYKIYFGIQFLFVASTFIDINWFFFGIEKFRLTVLRNSIIKVLSLISIFVFIHSNDDLWLYILIHSLSIFISASVLWPNVLSNIHIIKPSIKGVMKHIKPNMVMFIPVVAISIYKYMDKIMLGTFSIEQTGYFENSEKILSVILGLVTALGTVMLPRMSNLIANNQREIAINYFVRSMNFIMFLSVGITVGFFVVSDVFVPIFFGKGFEPCERILYGLAISTIFSSWANVIRTQFLIPNHKDNVYVISVILGALINFIGNFCLIRRYGAMGAVFSTIIAEATVAIVQTMASFKDLPYLKMFSNAIVFICIGVIVVFLMKKVTPFIKLSGFEDLALKMIITSFFYLSLCLIYNCFYNKSLLPIGIKKKN